MTNTLAIQRQASIRMVGWIAVALMLAVALLGPTAQRTLAAADENACNNIVNGDRSPDYVWVTTDADGLTVHWSLDEEHFGGAETVTVRGCVLIGDAEHGVISQNTANDGSEFYAWSEFGLEADPCPAENVQFGGSVDSPVVQTKKSNLIDCERETPSESVEASESVLPSESVEASESVLPSESVEASESVLPSESVEASESVAPSESVEASESVAPSESPEGSVLEETGSPAPSKLVTLPPTDGIAGTAAPASDTWRVLLLVMAGLLGSILVLTPSRSARRR